LYKGLSYHDTEISKLTNMATQIHVSIIVFRAEPLDYQKYRHTALWFRFQGGDDTVVMHVIGVIGSFEFEARDNYDPTTSAKFTKEISVGCLLTPMTKAELVTLISQTPPDNRDREFNCQVWVANVLSRLSDQGYLLKEQTDAGINDMVEATMEAEDEES